MIHETTKCEHPQLTTKTVKQVLHELTTETKKARKQVKQGKVYTQKQIMKEFGIL